MNLQHVQSLLQRGFEEEVNTHLPYIISLHPERLEKERLIAGSYALAIAYAKRLTQEDIDCACIEICKDGQKLQDFIIEAYELKTAKEKPGVTT